MTNPRPTRDSCGGCRRGLATAAALLALGGCTGHGEPGAAASATTTGTPSAYAGTRAASGLVRWPVPVSLTGDEQDHVDASPSGRWWLVSSYDREIDTRIDLLSGTVTDRTDHDYDRRPNQIDDAGVARRIDPGTPGDVLIDRSAGYTLRERRGRLVLRPPGTTAYRTIGTGYPVPGPELAFPPSLGTLSAGARYVTVPTTTPYAGSDSGRSLDVYQLDRRTGRWTRVSGAGVRISGAGVVASPSGRYVAFVGRTAGSATTDGQALRWDRRRGAVSVVSRAPDGEPGNGETLPALSVSDTGVVSFVSRATDLVPRGESDPQARIFTAPAG